MCENFLYYSKLTDRARDPFRATSKSVGFDLHSPKSVEIAPKSIVKIETDLAFQFPPSTYGRLAIRSSLAKLGLQVIGGVIDPDYTGNVTAILRNHGNNSISISEGERFVQIICEKATFPTLKKIKKIKCLTERNSKSFGSSGKY